jgi:hypothetical protein
MGLFSLIRTAQSENAHAASSVELERVCRCGAHLFIASTAEGTAGATPTGLLMSAEDLADAQRSASRSANRNARRNAAWARCPQCRRRGAWARTLATLSQLLVVIPAGLFGWIFGSIVGLVRQTISPGDLVSTIVTWGGGTAVVVLAFATWRRLRAADRSTQLEVRAAAPRR